MSGMRPTKKNTAEIVKYVLIANTSHMSGLLKLTHNSRWFGYGKNQYACQHRPRWSTGNRSAVMTANTVMASDARYTPVRHRDRTRNRIALISVPAWPIPIQN